MNFGQNLYTWLIANLQSLFLVGLGVVGVWFMIERKFVKAAGVLVVALIAAGFIYNAGGVKDILVQLFNQIFSV